MTNTQTNLVVGRSNIFFRAFSKRLATPAVECRLHLVLPRALHFCIIITLYLLTTETSWIYQQLSMSSVMSHNRDILMCAYPGKRFYRRRWLADAFPKCRWWPTAADRGDFPIGIRGCSLCTILCVWTGFKPRAHQSIRSRIQGYR